MALDYKQSAQLRTNLVFTGRIATAALQWASSIYGNTAFDVTNPDKRRELDYAKQIYQNSQGIASQIQPGVVQDPAVQAQNIDPETGDSEITDAYLQTAVEATIHKVI